MFVDSLIVPECVYRPGSFSGLMTVYESNFIKLARLIADLDELSADSTRVSRSPRDLDLHAEVQLREPYTTTLRLTYWFDESTPEPVPDPDLIVRVYGGDAPIASFYWFTNVVLSADTDAPNPDPTSKLVTLFLIKESGAWKIAATHSTPNATD